MPRPASIPLALPLALLALVAMACAAPVPIPPDVAARLAGGDPIPVVHVRSAPPWVDCPNEEGQKVWQMPGSASREIPWGARLASAAPSLPLLRTAGDVWETIQDQWTESLQTPPVDPAAATAAHLLARVAASPRPIPLAGPSVPVASASDALARARASRVPVLLVEAPRWVLVGCFFTYQPWFDAWATLLAPGTGEVLWREVCGGTYPHLWPEPASRDALEANDRALYARIIDERARQCADRMASSLAGAPAPPGPSATPAAAR